MLLVGIPTGTMFGIAHLVDKYGNWYFAVYIPWFYLLHLTMKIGDKLLFNEETKS